MIESIRNFAEHRSVIILIILLLLSFTFFSVPLYSQAMIILVIAVVIDAVSCVINVIWGCGGGGGSGSGGGGGGSGGSPSPTPPTFTGTGGSSGGSDGLGSDVSINLGDSSTLTWECVDSTSSTGVNFSTGSAASGSTDVSPTVTTSYTLTCSNNGEGIVKVNVIDPVISITATPPLLRLNETSVIEWTTSSVNSCSVSEDNPDFVDSWSGTSGTQTTSPITGETIYTLSCQTDGGSVSENTKVRLIPTFKEF